MRESFSYKTDCGLKYLNKFEKVHSVILRDSERKTQVHLVVFLFFFFFKSSDCIQLRLFQGLGWLNEAEGREWARKKGRLRDGGGRMC